MRLKILYFLVFSRLILLSQYSADSIPTISIDSLNNLSLNSQTFIFKVIQDTSFDAFSFKGVFESVEIYYDNIKDEYDLKLDSNGLFVPSEQMINLGVCYCKSCIERYSKISTKKEVLVKIIKLEKVEVVKHTKTLLKDVVWYKKSLIAGDVIRLDNILFVGGEARFRPISYKDLNRLFNVLDEDLYLQIEIQGHVNSPGKKNSKKNQDLSEARANAVRNYLINKGIRSNRLKSRGYGNTRMIYPNTKSQYEMQFNRRVEILVQ
mgnify:CR=1 FL=1